MKEYKLGVQSPHAQDVWIQAENVRFALSKHSTVIGSQLPASATQHWQSLYSSTGGKMVKFSLLYTMLSPQVPRHWVTLMLLSLRSQFTLILVKTSWRGIGFTSHLGCGTAENKTTPNNQRQRNNNYMHWKYWKLVVTPLIQVQYLHFKLF